MSDLENKVKIVENSSEAGCATLIWGSGTLANIALGIYTASGPEINWRNVGFFGVMTCIFAVPTGYFAGLYTQLKK